MDEARNESAEDGGGPASARTRSLGGDSVTRPGLAGRQIGHYRLIEELGHGGQGFVYLAEDERIRRLVALKILTQGQLLSPSTRLRFEREAEAAGRLDHPGIARVFELGEHEGIVFIAMELVKGRTLSKLIGDTAQRALQNEMVTEVHFDFSESEPATGASSRTTDVGDTGSSSADRDAIMVAVRFIEAAARALHAAHEQGLVHRDVKPGNLMVREDGSACVLDFGLAQDDFGTGVTLTRSGDLMGTPAYMSPEQLLAHRIKLDRRTDVYSLGVCLFEACTLQRPFAGRSQQELYQAISQKEPPSPRRINARIPKDLEAIILTAIDKDRDRRYLTALDFAEDLRRLRLHEPVRARPAGVVVKTMRWVQRNPVVTMLTAAVILALTSTAVVFYLKGEEALRARNLAESERNAKARALADYERLADVKRIEAAATELAALHPPAPELVPKLEDWLSRREELVGRLEQHRATLASLRARALPYTEEERTRDFAVELARIPLGRQAIAGIDRALAAADASAATRTGLLKERESFVLRVERLEAEVATGRRSWRFADQGLQFQHDVLTDLVRDLDRFVNDDRGSMKTAARLLEQSRTIAGATLEGAAAERWSACRERIRRNPRYAGLELAPQLGLVPLGPDPESGLEEFLHWLSHLGPLPERDEQGRIAVVQQHGIVLVLIPPGSFPMGAQKDDPTAPCHDPDARADEGPVTEVGLPAYFLAKHEMTQAQWRRATGENPSFYDERFGSGDARLKAPIDRRHPVERVSWDDAMKVLPQLGLDLPTEAEWERAARAGRDDQVFAGCNSVAELRLFANVKGAEAAIMGLSDRQEGHEDGFIVHAPVGSFRANGFGLHDMTGNVEEWCLDSGAPYGGETGPRGYRTAPALTENHIRRGGGFGSHGRQARVAFRNLARRDVKDVQLGLRPARTIR